MKNFLIPALILCAASYAQAIFVGKAENNSKSDVIIIDHGSGSSLSVNKFGDPLTEAQEKDLNVSRKILSFPHYELIEAAKTRSGLRLYGKGEVHTSRGTFGLGSADIRSLSIASDGNVNADGRILK